MFTQGSFQQTDNPLDLVIQGKGFFQIRCPTGNWPTRATERFQLDRNGNMVTSNGNPLQPQITIPPQAQSVTIAADGTVSYTQPGQTASQIAGQIQLATLSQSRPGSNSMGQNLFQPTDASGDPTVGNPGGQEGLGTLLQGYIEGSTSAWWRSSST